MQARIHFPNAHPKDIMKVQTPTNHATNQPTDAHCIFRWMDPASQPSIHPYGASVDHVHPNIYDHKQEHENYPTLIEKYAEQQYKRRPSSRPPPPTQRRQWNKFVDSWQMAADDIVDF